MLGLSSKGWDFTEILEVCVLQIVKTQITCTIGNDIVTHVALSKLWCGSPCMLLTREVPRRNLSSRNRPTNPLDCRSSFMSTLHSATLNSSIPYMISGQWWTTASISLRPQFWFGNVIVLINWVKGRMWWITPALWNPVYTEWFSYTNQLSPFGFRGMTQVQLQWHKRLLLSQTICLCKHR